MSQRNEKKSYALKCSPTPVFICFTETSKTLNIKHLSAGRQNKQNKAKTKQNQTNQTNKENNNKPNQTKQNQTTG